MANVPKTSQTSQTWFFPEQRVWEIWETFPDLVARIDLVAQIRDKGAGSSNWLVARIALVAQFPEKDARSSNWRVARIALVAQIREFGPHDWK